MTLSRANMSLKGAWVQCVSGLLPSSLKGTLSMPQNRGKLSDARAVFPFLGAAERCVVLQLLQHGGHS